MNDPTPRVHAELDALAELAADESAVDASLRSHVQSCPSCRLELAQLRRFEGIDADDELADEADWSVASDKLDRAYDEVIRPAALSSARRSMPRTASRRAARARWWIPAAAAAAAAIFLLVTVPRELRYDAPPGGDLPLRGGEAEAELIVPNSPQGDLVERPGFFEWSASAEFDSYELEIFTPALETVFRAEGLSDPRFAVADSVWTLLEAGQTYLWQVRGRAGLAADEASANVWFTVPPSE